MMGLMGPRASMRACDSMVAHGYGCMTGLIRKV